MTSRREFVPVDVLREALRVQVETATLRGTATLVGLSPNGLRNFLAGASPHPRTLQRLTTWYLRKKFKEGADAASELAKAALEILTSGMTENQRPGLQSDLLDAIRRHYEKVGAAPPVWLLKLQKERSRPPDGSAA
jgi:hypothetical protein